jgi:hypothetical protein
VAASSPEKQANLVKFILEINKRLVNFVIELHAAKHRADNKWANLFRGRFHIHDESLCGLNKRVGWSTFNSLKDSQRSSDSFNTQEVVSVRWDIDLVNHCVVKVLGFTLALLLRYNLFFARDIIEFDSKLKTKELELFLAVDFS